MLVLIGILIIIAGFLLRFNPLLVIMASALATGLAAGLDDLPLFAATLAEAPAAAKDALRDALATLAHRRALRVEPGACFR